MSPGGSETRATSASASNGSPISAVRRRAAGRSPTRSEGFPVAASIHERLRAGWTSKNSLLCVGLDPVVERLPREFQSQPNGFRDFCCAIVDATAGEVCAFKPQIAHFAAAGAENQLAEVIAYIHTRYPDVLVILDAKRGDIGAVAEFY